jgi:hypothetical protein
MEPVAAIVGVGCFVRRDYDICLFCEVLRAAFCALARVVSGLQRILQRDPVTDTDSIRQPTPVPRDSELDRYSTASCQEVWGDGRRLSRRSLDQSTLRNTVARSPPGRSGTCDRGFHALG